MRNQPAFPLVFSACVLALLAACSPAHEWRQVRAPKGSWVALLPCKPTLEERQVELQGRTWLWSLQACEVDGVRYALLSATRTGSAPPSPTEALELASTWQAAPVPSAQVSEWAWPRPARWPEGATWSPQRTRWTQGQQQGSVIMVHEGQLAQLSVTTPGPWPEAHLDTLHSGLAWQP